MIVICYRDCCIEVNSFCKESQEKKIRDCVARCSPLEIFGKIFERF